ncbi:hypothetical protein FS749_013956 [Ceratobasidium sp. UAMH 11750]|nr:hypothetical protein FS749_013956 [Ceratobasidium sp. UAMH 11750]
MANQDEALDRLMVHRDIEEAVVRAAKSTVPHLAREAKKLIRRSMRNAEARSRTRGYLENMNMSFFNTQDFFMPPLSAEPLDGASSPEFFGTPNQSVEWENGSLHNPDSAASTDSFDGYTTAASGI